MIVNIKAIISVIIYFNIINISIIINIELKNININTNLKFIQHETRVKEILKHFTIMVSFILFTIECQVHWIFTLCMDYKK